MNSNCFQVNKLLVKNTALFADSGPAKIFEKRWT
jgi:hypothetical protein